MSNKEITRKSASRGQLTAWRKLARRKEREKSGLFLAEGERCVGQILENGRLDVEALLVSESSGWQPPAAFDTVWQIPDREFDSILDTSTPQGVAAVCRIPPPWPDHERDETEGLVVAVDTIRDPGNLGTIIRSAVWFGAKGLICGDGSVDPWHPKVVRSTAGATGMLPVSAGALGPILNRMERAGSRILLLDAGPGAVRIDQVPKAGRMVLVVGSEAAGVDSTLFSATRERVRIEGAGGVESLNAAVALGIGLYELSHGVTYR